MIAKAALLLSVALSVSALAETEQEQQEWMNRFQQERGAARSILAKAEAHLKMVHASPEERVAAWSKWIESDLALIPDEWGSMSRLSSLAKLLAAKDNTEAAKVLSEKFKIIIDPTSLEASTKIADATREMLEGIKLGFEMGAMSGSKIDEWIRRFGPPTFLGKPENFGAKFEGVDKTVVVLCYDKALKNVYVDEDGRIFRVGHSKSLEFRKPEQR